MAIRYTLVGEKTPAQRSGSYFPLYLVIAKKVRKFIMFGPRKSAYLRHVAKTANKHDLSLTGLQNVSQSRTPRSELAFAARSIPHPCALFQLFQWESGIVSNHFWVMGDENWNFVECTSHPLETKTHISDVVHVRATTPARGPSRYHRRARCETAAHTPACDAHRARRPQRHHVCGLVPREQFLFYRQ